MASLVSGSAPTAVRRPPRASVSSRLLILGTAALIRLLLFGSNYDLSQLFGRRAEITTPLNSFRRLQEGLFLYQHDPDGGLLYDGGLYHQSPFFIALFSLLPPVSEWALPTNLVFVLLDVVIGNTLLEIAYQNASTLAGAIKSPRLDRAWAPATVAATYLFNPLVIMACLARSTSVFTNAAIVLSINSALQGHVFSLCFFLSLASHLSLYPLMLLPPLFYLCHQQRRKKKQFKAPVLAQAIQVVIFFLYLACFLGASYWFTGSTAFINATYGFQLSVIDLTPNVGLWWYFLTEMFDFFRGFFTGIFWIHMISYVFGFTIRFHRQPLFAVIAMLGVFATFLPYPSISDTAIFLSCLSLYSHIFSLMRYPFVAASTFLYSCFLGPTFYYLWIYAGSGNANFFYAITLVWAFAHIVLLGDAVNSVLLDELEVDHPDRVGKEVQLS